ncbi:DUF4157 domain-containing protein [Streptomyces sp. NPDC048219]|uniref:eCIS core domain-containing protein n=1 Tax=unclassified Streptomyces TaxID=2593676 RepID=UPI00341C9AA8
MRAQDNGKERDPANGQAGRPPRPSRTPSWAAGALALQRQAGNAAFSRAVSQDRHEHGAGCGHADAAVQRLAEGDRHRHGAGCGHEEAAVQRRVAPGDAIATPGRPLPSHILERVEQAYPMKFGHVRLHDGPVAQRSAADHGAVAYTTGSHIVSGRSSLDDETLFHEAGHVWQQAMGKVAGTDDGTGTRVSSPDDAFEVQAAEHGRIMARGGVPDLTLPGATASGAAVQRAAEPGAHVQRAPSGRVTKPQGRGGRRKKVQSVADSVADALVALGWKRRGANQSLTLHLVPDAQQMEEGTAKSVLDERYAGSANRSQAHSFDGARTRQVLRWVCTTVNRYLLADGLKPTEVQAATVRPAQDLEPTPEQEQAFKLFVSTNHTRVNDALRAGIDGQAADAYLLGLLEKVAPEEGREKRHTAKLRHLLSQMKTKENLHPDFWPVMAALAGQATVPDGEKDIHAERAIHAAAEKEGATADTYGGLKRPCVICYMELFQGTDRTPGPYWPSTAANTDIADYTADQAPALARRIDTVIRQAGGTRVTVPLNCELHQLTTDHDSDSDSPAPSEGERETEPMDTSA